MADITYLISLRDNIDNQEVTGSTILPYYPPASPPLQAPYISSSYIITQDTDQFVGWSVKRTTLPVYKTTNGRIIRTRLNNLFYYYITVEYPPEADIEFKKSLGTVEFDFDLEENYTAFTPDRIAELLSEFERDQAGFAGNTSVRKYRGSDILPASGSLQPPTNGFRIKTPGYQDLTLFADNPDGSPRIPTEEGAIDLGIVNLIRVQANTAKEIASMQTVDSAAILANAPSSEKITGTDKLSQLLESRAVDLKTILVTAIVAKVSEFGISNIKEIIEGKVDLDKLPRLCPTEAKLKEVIALRNRYANQLNTFYNNLTRLSTTLTGTNKIAQAISTTLAVTAAARKAANIALGFLPVVPGAAPSAINVLKDLEESISPKLNNLLKGLGVLTSTVAFVSGIILTIIELLKILDQLILLCAQDTGVPFSEINNELTALNNNITKDLQNSTSNIDNTYKGFKFEIILDTKSNIKYPKRYAVGKDKFGVTLLRGESSFTPNTEVLINELKFIIDRDNLSAE